MNNNKKQLNKVIENSTHKRGNFMDINLSTNSNIKILSKNRTDSQVKNPLNLKIDDLKNEKKPPEVSKTKINFDSHLSDNKKNSEENHNKISMIENKDSLDFNMKKSYKNNEVLNLNEEIHRKNYNIFNKGNIIQNPNHKNNNNEKDVNLENFHHNILKTKQEHISHNINDDIKIKNKINYNKFLQNSEKINEKKQNKGELEKNLLISKINNLNSDSPLKKGLNNINIYPDSKNVNFPDKNNNSVTDKSTLNLRETDIKNNNQNQRNQNYVNFDLQKEIKNSQVPNDLLQIINEKKYEKQLSFSNVLENFEDCNSVYNSILIETDKYTFYWQPMINRSLANKIEEWKKYDENQQIYLNFAYDDFLNDVNYIKEHEYKLENQIFDFSNLLQKSKDDKNKIFKMKIETNDDIGLYEKKKSNELNLNLNINNSSKSKEDEKNKEKEAFNEKSKIDKNIYNFSKNNSNEKNQENTIYIYHDYKESKMCKYPLDDSQKISDNTEKKEVVDNYQREQRIKELYKKNKILKFINDSKKKFNEIKITLNSKREKCDYYITDKFLVDYLKEDKIFHFKEYYFNLSSEYDNFIKRNKINDDKIFEFNKTNINDFSRLFKFIIKIYRENQLLKLELDQLLIGIHDDKNIKIFEYFYLSLKLSFIILNKESQMHLNYNTDLIVYGQMNHEEKENDLLDFSDNNRILRIIPFFFSCTKKNLDDYLAEEKINNYSKCIVQIFIPKYLLKNENIKLLKYNSYDNEILLSEGCVLEMKEIKLLDLKSKQKLYLKKFVLRSFSLNSCLKNLLIIPKKFRIDLGMNKLSRNYEMLKNLYEIILEKNNISNLLLYNNDISNDPNFLIFLREILINSKSIDMIDLSGNKFDYQDNDFIEILLDIVERCRNLKVLNLPKNNINQDKLLKLQKIRSDIKIIIQ